MSKKIVDFIALFFILCVGFLAVISILSIWKVIDGDVVFKSLATVGIVAFASIVSLIASRYMGDSSSVETNDNSLVPLFGAIRYLTSGILIVCITLLTIIGVMAIWDMITDKDTLAKVVGSMIVLAISSMIMVVSCADREGKTVFGKQSEGHNNQVSLGRIILLLVIGAWVLSIFSGLF